MSISKFRLLVWLFFTILSFLFIQCKLQQEFDEQIAETYNFPSVFSDTLENALINVNDTIYIKTNESFLGLDSIKYRIDNKTFTLSMEDISISPEVDFSMSWVNEDSIQITFNEVLSTNTIFNITIILGWHSSFGYYEETIYDFQVLTNSNQLPSNEIVSVYPVNRQYYFLQDEYPFGFYQLKRRPRDIDLFKVEFRKANNELVYSIVPEFNALKNEIIYNMPDLDNETIYSANLIIDDEKVHESFFRTSKYNTFAEKMINYRPSTNKPWRLSSPNWKISFELYDNTISEEGFDFAEANSEYIAVLNGIDTLVEYGYCNGLIQLSAITEGCEFFQDYAYPVIYAPFDDLNIKPNFTPYKVLGDTCKYALNFLFSNELHSLTDDEIESNVANKSFQDSFKIISSFAGAMELDYKVLQDELVDLYINESTLPDRIHKVIFSPFENPGIGHYNFNINYRLPDGTITYTQFQELYFFL